VDGNSDRLGEVVSVADGGQVTLRPLHAGPTWETELAAVRPADQRAQLRAKLAAANRWSRWNRDIR
jgi:hypothetical protein